MTRYKIIKENNFYLKTLTMEIPQNQIAERSLIACLLLDNNKLYEIQDLHITKSDFFNYEHANLYEAIDMIIMS